MNAVTALREIEEVLEKMVSPCVLEDSMKAKFDVVRRCLDDMTDGLDKLRRKADNLFYGEDEEEAEKAEEAEPEEQAGAPPEEATQGDAKRAKTAE